MNVEQVSRWAPFSPVPSAVCRAACLPGAVGSAAVRSMGATLGFGFGRRRRRCPRACIEVDILCSLTPEKRAGGLRVRCAQGAVSSEDSALAGLAARHRYAEYSYSTGARGLPRAHQEPWTGKLQEANHSQTTPGRRASVPGESRWNRRTRTGGACTGMTSTCLPVGP